MKLEFKFPIGAFEVLAEKHGSVGEALGKFRNIKGVNSLSRETLELVVDLAYAGLKWQDKKITREYVAENLFVEDIPAVVTSVAKALGLALPEPTGEPGNPPEA